MNVFIGPHPVEGNLAALNQTGVDIYSLADRLWQAEYGVIMGTCQAEMLTKSALSKHAYSRLGPFCARREAFGPVGIKAMARAFEANSVTDLALVHGRFVDWLSRALVVEGFIGSRSMLMISIVLDGIDRSRFALAGRCWWCGAGHLKSVGANLNLVVQTDVV